MALPEFIWPAHRVRTEDIKYNTLITKFESGKEQRRSKGSPKRKFQLKFEKQETPADEIYNFFKARKGKFEVFNWTHPRTGEVIKVRFGVDKLSREVFYDLMFKFGLPLVEVL